SGAAINIILAPWFQRRRGLAVSLAFNGATLGGVIVVPALIALVGWLGFARALTIAALVLLVALLVIATMIMRTRPEALGLGPDAERPACRSGVARARAVGGERLRGLHLVRSRRRKPDDLAGADPRRRVAARALQRARRSRGRHQPADVRLRPLARRGRPRPG